MAGRRLSLTARILLGLAAGVAVGLLLGRAAAPLGELGRLVIQAIKAAAAPLLALTIVNAAVATRVRWASGLRLVLLATANAAIALGLGLAVSNALQPGRHLSELARPAAAAAAPAQRLEPLKVVSGLVPASVVQPLADNAVLPLVVMALLLGLSLRRLKESGEDVSSLERAFAALQRALETILSWIISLVPLAVFAVAAKSVGEHGLSPLRGLAAYVGAGLLALLLQPLATYQLWLVLFVRLKPRRFWEAAREPLVYAVGANSSLATLPLTLKALDRLGVSKASSALGACVGTNLNNDGVLLYEAMAVLFVAQAHGLQMSLGQQAGAALCSLVAAMGIAGVPEAGFVSLSLVLATVGLPMELLPLLLTVDWILARARSAVNVLSDMMLSILLDRWDGRRFDLEAEPGLGSAPLPRPAEG